MLYLSDLVSAAEHPKKAAAKASPAAAKKHPFYPAQAKVLIRTDLTDESVIPKAIYSFVDRRSALTQQKHTDR
jgi:hypothetical protein